MIADQAALGHHPGIFEKQRADLLLDVLKNKALSVVKSNIMCQSQLYNDLNVTANHLKDVVNHMPELQIVPGRQVSAVGRGGGHGRGTGRGGHDGHGFDSGRGRGGRDSDRSRRGVRISSSTNFSPETCPHKDAVDRVKPNIVHRHVTSNRIFVDDHT